MKPSSSLDIYVETPPPHEFHGPSPMDMSKWELLYQLHYGNNLLLDYLHMYGHHEFDAKHN